MRLLIVEDYAPLRLSLAKGLREAGYAVDEAGDGEVALWQAGGSQFDAIILDLMLPKVDGLTVLTRLRKDGYDRPILILTARDTVPDRVKGLDCGADDYLVKPFAFEELLARVRAMVRRQYDRKSPVLEMGALRLDTAARRTWVSGRAVELTAREYALLEYLALRAGQVVARADIWEHLYEFDSNAQSNVVDVYIGYLRRKLGKAGSMLRTVRGSGYMLGTEP